MAVLLNETESLQDNLNPKDDVAQDQGRFALILH